MRGFTLIELMLVMLIISSLAVIALGTYGSDVKASQSEIVTPSFSFEGRLHSQMVKKYKRKYYEVACFHRDRPTYRDWSENDLSVYKDGRVEYYSIVDNKIITLHLGPGSLCKSTPPNELWSNRHEQSSR